LCYNFTTLFPSTNIANNGADLPTTVSNPIHLATLWKLVLYQCFSDEMKLTHLLGCSKLKHRKYIFKALFQTWVCLSLNIINMFSKSYFKPEFVLQTLEDRKYSVKYCTLQFKQYFPRKAHQKGDPIINYKRWYTMQHNHLFNKKILKQLWQSKNAWWK